MAHTFTASQKQRARKLMYAAIRSGALVPSSTCQECSRTAGKKRLDGHHHRGYSDEHALDVQWLCKACHSAAHSGFKNMSPEKRSEVGRLGGRAGGPARMAAMTPEERSAMGHMGGVTGGRAALAKRTPEQRSAVSRLGTAARNAKLTPERRSEIASKAGRAAAKARAARKAAAAAAVTTSA